MKYWLIALCCLFTVITNAQVRLAKAFVKMSAPGTIRAGEGKRLIVHRFIYIETTGMQLLTIKKISANGIILKHSFEEVEGSGIEVGRLKSNDKVQYFKALKGNRLWKIIIDNTSHKLLTGLRIQGTVGKKSFNYSAGKEIQLAPDLYP